MASSRNQPTRIACLGECMIELSDLIAEDGRARLGVAGDTLNTAVYLARILPPETAAISYLTALGPDQFSERMLSFMAGEGIDTTHVARIEDKLPGIYAIELDQAGERSFRYWRSQSAARSMFRPGAIDLSVLDSFDVIYLSGISLAILPPDDRSALLAKLGEMKAAGRMIAFDSNYRPKLWSDRQEAQSAMAAAWRVATIALPSLDDEIALGGPATAQDVIARISSEGVSEVALKRGPDGPVIMVEGVTSEGSFAPARVVLDTTAAGDSFNAGYLAGRIAGQSPVEAAQKGHALASHVIGHSGAIVDLDAVSA